MPAPSDLVTPTDLNDRLDSDLLMKCMRRDGDPNDSSAKGRLARLCKEANAFVLDHAQAYSSRHADGVTFEVPEGRLVTFKRIGCDVAHGMLAARYPSLIDADGHKLLEDALTEIGALCG